MCVSLNMTHSTFLYSRRDVQFQ